MDVVDLTHEVSQSKLLVLSCQKGCDYSRIMDICEISGSTVAYYKNRDMKEACPSHLQGEGT